MRTAISLFTGVGGLDFGLEAAGFATAVAVERDPSACSTIKLNRDWPLIAADLADVPTSAVLAHAQLSPGEPDLLAAGPPCQPFSKSAYWVNGDTRRMDDRRADTLDLFLRVLGETRPKAFLLENVQGLAYAGKDEGLRHLLDGIRAVNRKARTRYEPVWQVLNAADFGVPQVRKRVFLVGARDGERFRFPIPTHGPAGSRLIAYRTAWDAIGDLCDAPEDLTLRPGGKWAGLLPTIPEGENYLWHTPRGHGSPLFGWRTRYWTFLLKLAKNRPSWTIHAQPGSATGPFHWDNRRLSPDEMSRIQTFPRGITFECGRVEQQRMIGNAVPSLLTEILGREIRTQLLGDRRSTRGLRLLPPDRGSPPPARNVSRLPAKYKSLIAEYADHPGEGRGIGALRQQA